MKRPEPRAASSPFVGLLERRGRFMQAVPAFPAPGGGSVRPLIVDPKAARGRHAREGDLVLLRAHGQGRGRARLVRTIGRPDIARDVIEALMLDRGLRRDFDPAVSHDARRPPVQDASRRDLRDLATFTIDPASAQDFDDAISAQELGPGRWRIWVHIADVSAHVRPGSAVDREARRRGTSVYVPGTVEPMLPPVLSNKACSLVPGEDRLAVTVEFDLHGADVERAAFHRSLIRSDERLDYERVDRIFAGHEQSLDPWAAPLAAARAAAAALDAARAKRGALLVETSEPEFSFDSDGHVTGVRGSVGTESHRLIEHLMITANEQVATLLSNRSIPTLYRVHERPQPASAQRLVEQLASLDIPTPPVDDHLSPQQAGALIAEISAIVDAHVRRQGHGRAALTSLVLRTLKQAHYSAVNVGHHGLGSERYCHFTSPIRRYPDLICHRSLLSAVGAGEQAPRASGMEEEGVWASARERDAVGIERTADDIARCFLLKRELFSGAPDRAFEGEVVGLIGAGAFVAFGDGYEGMLPVRRMKGWWEINEHNTVLHGDGRAIRLGDPVSVQVGRVDELRGRVDLHPAGGP